MTADPDQPHHGVHPAPLVPFGEVAPLDDVPSPILQEKAELLEAVVHELDAAVDHQDDSAYAPGHTAAAQAPRR